MLTSQKMIANAQQAAGRRSMAMPANARRSNVRCDALPRPEDAGKAAAAVAASMLLLAPTPAIAAPNQAAEVADLTSTIKGLVNKGKSASNRIQDRAPDVVDVPASDVPAQAQKAIDIPPVADILKPLAAEPAPAPKGKKELTLLEEDERSREGGDGSGLDLNVPSPPKPLATSAAISSAEPVATVALTDPAARVRRGDAGTSGETTVNKGTVQSLGRGFKSSLKDEVNQAKDLGDKAASGAQSLADKVTSKTSSSMAAPQEVFTVALSDPAQRVRAGDAGTSGETSSDGLNLPSPGDVNEAVKDAAGKASSKAQDLVDKIKSATPKDIDTKPISDVKAAAKNQAPELVANAKVAERKTKETAKGLLNKGNKGAERLDAVTDEAGDRLTQGAKDAKGKVEGFLRKRYI